MTITMNPTNTTNHRVLTRARRTKSARSIARVLFSGAAAFSLLGAVPTAASAQADSFVACIPSEFETCPGAEEPEEPNPFVVVDGLVFCGTDLDGNPICPDDPDPGPSTPFEGPDELVICGEDLEGESLCDEGDPDPQNPFGGPGDLVSCGLDDQGQSLCPGEGEGEGGIDTPVSGDPDFTG